MGSGALQKAAQEQEEDPLAMIQRGAGLQESEWPAERVAAVVRSLPKDFQTPVNAIALFERSVPAGLNPLADEIWAWEHRGELQFMVSRDGWIKIADRDEKVTGLDFGLIYENDDFTFTKKQELIEVEHSGSLDRGDLVGAYCVVHHEGGDHLERRLVKDYEHKSGGAWSDNEQEMLLTRTISFAVRLKCPEGAGLHSKAEFELAEDGEGRKRRRASKAAKESTDEAASDLADQLEEQAGEEIEVDAEEVDVDGASPEDEGKEPASSSSTDQESESRSDGSSGTPASPESSDEGKDEPSTSADTASPDSEGSSDSPEEDEGPEETIRCEVCTEDVARSSYPGHKGGHSRNGLKLPDPVERIVEEGDGYGFVEKETGEIRVGAAGPWGSWEKAVKAAQALAEQGVWDDEEELEPTPDEPSESESTEPSDDSPAEPDEGWDSIYASIMDLRTEHPDGLRWVYRVATDLFADRDVPKKDDGTVKIGDLEAAHLAELRQQMRDRLEEADL